MNILLDECVDRRLSRDLKFNTASRPIDALGVDADGEIYIIEAKLNKNADRRRIIAQALDYGAALWASEEALMQRLPKLEGIDYKQAAIDYPEPA